MFQKYLCGTYDMVVRKFSICAALPERQRVCHGILLRLYEDQQNGTEQSPYL